MVDRRGVLRDHRAALRKIQAFSARIRARFEAQLPAPARDYLSRMQDAADLSVRIEETGGRVLGDSSSRTMSISSPLQ